MVMVGIFLSCLPYAGYLHMIGISFLPTYLLSTGQVERLIPGAALAGFLLLVGGIFQCLKAPPESDSRKLFLFAGATLVGLRFLAVPAVFVSPFHWLILPLNLAVDLALLLALCRLAVFYQRRDLLGSFFMGAGAAVIQTLICLLVSTGMSSGLTRPLMLLTWVCLLLYAVLVSVAVGRLAVSAGEGPPQEATFPVAAVETI